jgi:hypothetical protein
VRETDEIFPQRYRAKEARPDSFAEQQARLASDKATAKENLGENLLYVLQGGFVPRALVTSALIFFFLSARIILSWFYWSHARSCFFKQSPKVNTDWSISQMGRGELPLSLSLSLSLSSQSIHRL